MSVYSAKQKALYVINKRVAKRFPHYTHNQIWAITYSIYNKKQQNRRGFTTL